MRQQPHKNHTQQPTTQTKYYSTKKKSFTNDYGQIRIRTQVDRNDKMLLGMGVIATNAI